MAALLLLPLVGAAACGSRSTEVQYRPPRVPTDAATGSDALDATGPPEPYTGSEPLRIATFNVQRLFDTICDSGSCGGDAYEALPTSAQLRAQTRQLAEAITDLDAHVVLLQEVETQRALDALFDRLTGSFLVAVLGETGEPASVDVAVLANGDVVRVVSHADTPLERPDGSRTSFARDFLEVHLALTPEAIQAQRTELIVFSAHFKSKSNDDPGRRLAEAEAARQIVASVAAENPDVLVVLGGDLNDVPDSPPIDALEDGGQLVRVASDQPAELVTTYVFAGQGQAIDHLFIASEASGHYVEQSAASVWSPSGIGYGGSDHAALRADFLLER